MNEFCTIKDIAVMTGLSTRTIRSYLASGQLKGEKIDNAWRFTPEQFEAFLRQDMVRQSVRAKANGKIYDFLLTERRKESAVCLIWDWPARGGEEENRLRERLMEAVNKLELGCVYHFEESCAGPSSPGHRKDWRSCWQNWDKVQSHDCSGVVRKRKTLQVRP